MNLLPILLVTLVLRTGERITVDDSVREENGRVLFRSEGTLYTLPATEVEEIVEGLQEESGGSAARVPRASEPKLRLRVSEEERKRLIAELEQNHSGTPAPPTQTVKPVPPPRSRAEVRRETAEERNWRREAREHEENIRRAMEDLALLENRASELQSRIFGLISLGYKPRQFTYDSTQLARTLERIPRAQLEVTRAERAYEQFREDARRQDVPPGWLR